MKKAQCKYCFGTKKIQGSHLSSCCFNPKNNALIIEYLTNLVLEDKPLFGIEYNKFAREHGLPKTSTMLNQFKLNFFQKSHVNLSKMFAYIIYRSYELNLVNSLEILDLLVYQLTFGAYGFSALEYLDKMDQIVDKTEHDQQLQYAARMSFLNRVKELNVDVSPD